MARQETYVNDQDLSSLDRLTGIDVLDNSTKNFTIEGIAQFFASTGIADPARLGFHYDFAGITANPPRGYFSYTTIPGVSGAVGVSEIKVHRYANNGQDFAPISGYLTSNDIKVTDVDNASDINYAIYAVNKVELTGDVYTLTVVHQASDGPIADGQTVLSLVGNTSAIGNSVFERSAVPTVSDPIGRQGDLVVREYDDASGETNVDLYVHDGTSWGDPVSLTGQKGDQGIQGFQGVGIAPGTAAGDNTMVGQPTTFTVNLNNPDSSGPQDGTLSFTVPAGAKGDTGAGLDGALLNFTENGANIDVTYDGTAVGNFPAPLDGSNGTSVTGLVQENTPAAGQTTVTITSDGNAMSFIVMDGAGGTNVTAEAQANGSIIVSEDGVAVGTLNNVTVNPTGAGAQILVNGTVTATIIDGANGTNVTANAISGGVQIFNNGVLETTIVNGTNGTNVTAVDVANGVEVFQDGVSIGVVMDGTQGVQGTVTYRFYIDEVFGGTTPTIADIVITDTGNFTVPTGWTLNAVPGTYDAATDDLWIAEYEWNPAGGGVGPIGLTPIKLTGPQGAGSGSSDVDGIKVEGTTLSLDEAGAATGITVPIAQGTTNNDTLASQGYVDTQNALDVKLTPGTNQVITQVLGTVLDVRGSFDLEDNAGGKSFDFSGTSGDIHIEDNGDIKLYFDKSSGKVFYDDTNTGTLSTATVNELATQGDISGHGISNVDDVVIDAGRIKIDEAGTPTGTGIELATGTADNDKVATQGYVDDNAGDVNRTPAQLKTAYEGNANTNAFEDLEKSKLAGIENNATADQTDAEIKTAYENNANTNAFTDADVTKLGGIEAGAQVNPTALSAFINDEDFIDLSDVPVRFIDFQRTTTEDVQILPGGTLRLHLAARSGAFTYGFTSVPSQVDGSLAPFTVTLNNIDANHTAEITSIAAVAGITFNIAAGGQSFTATPDDAVIGVGTIDIIPTVESTNIGSGVTADNTAIVVPYEVTAPIAPPDQADYFYYGVTTDAATLVNLADDTLLTSAEIATGAEVDGGTPAAAGVTRDVVDQGDKTITLGDTNNIVFIAIPDTITPVFHDTTLSPTGLIITFDYTQDDTINTVDYIVYKGAVNAGTRIRITF